MVLHASGTNTSEAHWRRALLSTVHSSGVSFVVVVVVVVVLVGWMAQEES
jgi:hypothetical protein